MMRRLMGALAVAAAAEQRLAFGPLEPGSVIDGIELAVGPNALDTSFDLGVRLSGSSPSDSTQFATGDNLVRDAANLTVPFGVAVKLPVAELVEPQHRFLVFQVVNAGAGTVNVVVGVRLRVPLREKPARLKKDKVPRFKPR